jgi:geranylgeranyl diphosphate synthase type I
MELGYVFQLRDDWLGEYGDTEKTGKPVGNDSREGKHTYATMNGKEKTEVAIREHMKLAMSYAKGNEIMGERWVAGDKGELSEYLKLLY